MEVSFEENKKRGWPLVIVDPPHWDFRPDHAYCLIAVCICTSVILSVCAPTRYDMCRTALSLDPVAELRVPPFLRWQRHQIDVCAPGVTPAMFSA